MGIASWWMFWDGFWKYSSRPIKRGQRPKLTSEATRPTRSKWFQITSWVHPQHTHAYWKHCRVNQKFQLEARGQEPSNQWNNDLRLEQPPVVPLAWELHHYGWFGMDLENIQADPSKEARGQSWPQRPPDQQGQNDFKSLLGYTHNTQMHIGSIVEWIKSFS